MASSRRYEVGVGCLVVVAIGLLAFMALQVGAITGMGDRVVIDVRMHDAAGLSEGAVVSIAGVQVGRVESLAVDFDRARASVSLDEETEVRRDAHFAVRARSVLGEKYLEITPISHDAPLLVDGDQVEVTGGQLEIDEMVSRMGPLLDAVDPEAIRHLGRSITEDPERIGRMLDDAEIALHNAAMASAELPLMVSEARDTLASVRRTSDQARPLLTQLDGTAQRLDALIRAVPPDQVPALLDELSAAVKDGRAIVQNLDGTTSDLNELLKKANGITEDDIETYMREKGVLIRLWPRKPKRD